MQSKAERIAMIKASAKRLQQSKTREARFVRMEAKPSKSNAKSFLDNSDSMKDERYYTDASKYAKEWYGEVYHETTRFDNDWN